MTNDSSYIQAFGVANLLTIFRMFLIPVFVIASVYQLHLIAFVMFVVAVVTDFLDGYIARYPPCDGRGQIPGSHGG